MHGSLFKHLFMFEILLVCTMRKMDWGIGYFVVKGINSLVFSWATLGFFLCISFFASLCFLHPPYFSFIYIILYFCFFLDLRKIVLLHRKKWIVYGCNALKVWVTGFLCISPFFVFYMHNVLNFACVFGTSAVYSIVIFKDLSYLRTIVFHSSRLLVLLNFCF